MAKVAFGSSHRLQPFFVLALVCSALISHAGAREVSRAERFAAFESIDRAYYHYQEGRTLPFEQAVPRSSIERKVRRTIALSVALRETWNLSITLDMLDQEWRRISDGTKLPGRLDELYRALNNSPILIRETLVRSSLVERLAWSHFVSDPRFRNDNFSEWVERITETWGNESLAPLETAATVEPGWGPQQRYNGVSPNCVGDDSWTRGALALESPAGDASTPAVWTGSYVVMLAQSSSRYNPLLNSWFSVSTQGAPLLHPNATVAWDGRDVIVWSGEDSYEPNGTGSLYDPIRDSWRAMSPVDAPSARFSTAHAWTGSKLVVWGGGRWELDPVSGDYFPVYFDDGAVYDPALDVWSPMSAVGSPSARMGATGVVLGRYFVVWGGQDSAGALTDGGRFELATGTWKPMSNLGAPAPRVAASTAGTGSHLLIWGGQDGTGITFGDGYRYHAKSDTWSAMSSTNAPTPRYHASTTSTGRELVVWGGLGDSGTLGDGARYEPVSDQWKSMSSAGAPSARWSSVAVWTGDEVLIWSGVASDGSSSVDGGRYSVERDEWAPIARGNPGPSPRSDEVSGWTGNFLLVWGGWSPQDRGWKWDPVLDNWTPMSDGGAPSVRHGSSAVWSGDRFIVWGGTGSLGQAPTDGGQYFPLADSWSHVSEVGAPTGREHAQAVWSGSEMLILDGVATGGGEARSDRGRYDPAGDNWQAVTSTNAPAPRYGATITWAANRAVLWGGTSTDLVIQATGSAYDPASDSWNDIETTGAPAARQQHSAVAVGDQVYFWGGFDQNGEPLSDGKRLDLAQNAWFPVSSLGAPGPRFYHSAVWTGDEMLIWGGLNPSYGGYLASGGRYSPALDSWRGTAQDDHTGPARSGHSAYWTGQWMIVWGGIETSGALYSLGASDIDGDRVADACDCAPSDPTAHKLPSEAKQLRFRSDKTTLFWEPASIFSGPGTTHDLIRGAVEDLPVNSGSHFCMANDSVLEASDASVPTSGEAWWYLVRANNVCGVGGYGVATDGMPRDSAACP